MLDLERHTHMPSASAIRTEVVGNEDQLVTLVMRHVLQSLVVDRGG